jgi:YD repeat-containing protein
MTDARGYKNTYGYDTAGSLTKTVNPSREITSYEYEALGRAVKTTHPNKAGTLIWP